MSDVKQAVVFLIHAIKQFCFGFEQLNESSEQHGDGSAAKAFYLNSIYHYLAVFYLLDRGSDAMGGTFYKALKRHDLTDHLEPIQDILDSPLGGTTFGEVVRVFRNEAIVHTTYRDADLDRIYESVDMEDSAVQEQLQSRLVEVFVATHALALKLVDAAGLDPEEVGIRHTDG